MKICLISREFTSSSHVGGIGTYSGSVARISSAHGDEVHVITVGKEARHAVENGFHVWRVPLLPHTFNPAPWLYYFRALYRKLFPVYLDALTWARTAAASFARLNEIEHFQVLEYPETMGEGACLNINREVFKVCRIHTSSLYTIASNVLETRKILKLQLQACAKADKIVSPSHFAAGPYAKKTLKWKGRVFVSPNPVVLWDEEVDWAAKQIFHLLYVGRIEYRKGLTFFLTALEKLKAKGFHADVKIIGNNGGLNTAMDRKCRETLKTFQSQNVPRKDSRSVSNDFLKVEILPHQEHEHLYRHFDWAGLYILPSLSENYPYVALEALSRGCYVIASRTGGIPEIITSESKGLLFKAGDAVELANHLAYCLENPELIRQRALGSAEKIIRDFSPELCYKRLRGIYERS